METFESIVRGNGVEDDGIEIMFLLKVAVDARNAPAMLELILEHRPEIYDVLKEIYLKSTEKQWRKFPTAPGTQEVEIEIYLNAHGIPTSTNWQRAKNYWGSNGVWKEINVKTMQERIRLVDVDEDRKPNSLDLYRNPKTLALTYKDFDEN